MNRVFIMNNLLVAGVIVLGFAGVQYVRAQELVGSGGVSISDRYVIKAARFAVKARAEALSSDGKTNKITLVKIVKASKRTTAYEAYDLELQIKVGEKLEKASAGVWRGYSAKYELMHWNDEQFEVNAGGEEKLKPLSVAEPGVLKASQFAIKARLAELKEDGKSINITLVKIVQAQQRASLKDEVYDLNLNVKIGSATRTACPTVARWSSGEYELIEWHDFELWAPPSTDKPAKRK